MNLFDIQKRMLNWRDFFGFGIADTVSIMNAKNKKELRAVLEKHRTDMEDMLRDANTDLDAFKKELGLDY